mmetsp:Transcript_24260/g.39343  ORF Transcript_24260/g.39343 Transcript_24260/m.39343 type:complete len:262 (+) Transcript_24260:224-1009(+)
MFATGRQIIRTEGTLGLWRGNFVNCVRVFPSRGILFSFNDLYKGIIVRYWYGGEFILEGGKLKREGDKECMSLPIGMSFVSGSTAGMTACALTYPLDVARTRMSGLFFDKGIQAKSLSSTMISMVRNEGFGSLYRGVGLTLIGSLPYEGIKFASFDMSQAIISQKFPEYSNAAWTKLLSGAIAGTIAGTIMFPNDTVRRLLHLEGMDGKRAKYRSGLDCYVKTIKQEGVARLFRGLVPYLARVIPNSAIQFGVYELLKREF